MSESNELVVMTEESRFLPVMKVETGIERYNSIQQAINKMMTADVDYGVIPGTSENKPSLWKPGAEKLNNLFGLTPRYECIAIEDWTGEAHGGEPFFYYRVKCSLYRGDYLIGEGEGSCNSWESKYRYRAGERKCPKCGQSAIIKGREEYGGGWICFAKKGGCGAKFAATDPTITLQRVGRVSNPDIYDQVNVFLKMADKRALVAATLNATGASQFFTQDLEDLTPVAAPEPAAKQTTKDFAMLRAYAELKPRLGEKLYYEMLGAAGYEHANEILDPDVGRSLYRAMNKRTEQQPAAKPAEPDEWDEWEQKQKEQQP